MNLYDRLKKFHREVFLKRQAVIAHETAAEDFTASQDVTQKAMKAAAETIKLANELAADNDPHIKRLALLIKDSVVGAAEDVATGPLPDDGRKAIEADSPFSEISQPSGTSLPNSTKALPHTPQQQQPPTVKRGPGRPRKQPQE
jgi:hypothetical protein